jgi:hypothetical protein
MTSISKKSLFAFPVLAAVCMIALASSAQAGATNGSTQIRTKIVNGVVYTQKINTVTSTANGVTTVKKTASGSAHPLPPKRNIAR